MRIGIICHSNMGGSGRIATELAIELSRRGHRVHLFSYSEPFAASDQLHQVVSHQVRKGQEEASFLSPVKVEWSPMESQALLAQVLRVVEREGLDLLHFHYAVPFAYIARKILECLGPAAPLVVGTLHGTDVSVYGRHPVAGPRLTDIFQYLDGLTTVSHSHAVLAAQVFGLPKLPVVIPNFVDLSRFRPGLAAPLTLQQPEFSGGQRPRIVHVSNFRAIKNPQGLAHIFLGIKKKLDAELWLVGKGPGLVLVKALLNHDGVGQDVRLLGALHQVAPILCQAQLLLMHSLSESFCLAALESMACGVPVLASRVGGLPEVVAHGQSGYLVPLGDYDAAVNLAVELLSNPARYQAMRKAAVVQAGQFGQDRIVSLYENLYQNLIAACQPGYRAAAVQNYKFSRGVA